jgi:hypothetical protein
MTAILGRVRPGNNHVMPPVSQSTATADIAAVDAVFADDGGSSTVALTGICDSDAAVPALISWPCRGGTIVAVNERDGWPYVHVAHLSAAGV